MSSRAPVAILEVAGDEALLAGEPLLARGYASYLAVPLFGAEGELQGVLAVLARRQRSWQEEEIEALRRACRERLGRLREGRAVPAGRARAGAQRRHPWQRRRRHRRRRPGRAIVLWNAAAERITGVPAEEALGRSVPDVLQRELRSESGAVAGDRLVPIRRADNEVWLSLTEAVMRDPSGETAGRIFAFRDISAERVVEQMRSDFVSTVSHELRAPLTSIYGFAATLLREDVEFEEEERRTSSPTSRAKRSA